MADRFYRDNAGDLAAAVTKVRKAMTYATAGVRVVGLGPGFPGASELERDDLESGRAELHILPEEVRHEQPSHGGHDAASRTNGPPVDRRGQAN